MAKKSGAQKGHGLIKIYKGPRAHEMTTPQSTSEKHLLASMGFHGVVDDDEMDHIYIGGSPLDAMFKRELERELKRQAPG